MKIKNILSIIPVIAIGIMVLMTSSCKKMLEIPENAPGQLITDLVFSDSSTAVSGVVGMYSHAFSSNGPLSQYMSQYPSLSSGDLTSTFLDQQFYNNALTVGTEALSGPSSFIWNSFYNNNFIYQANAAIEAIKASNTISQSLKDQLTGECKMMRALGYFYLVNLYGPVPLATTTNYTINSKLPRASVDTVYAQITRDLVDAGNLMNENYPSAGRARPNKYTALALLSRVYLYLQKWSEAETTASLIINAGNYQLETIENVFVAGNQEAIWQAVNLGFFDYATIIGSVFVPYSPDIIPQYHLTGNLLNAFEADDQRAINWIASTNVEGINYSYPYKYKNREGIQVDGRIEGEVLFRLSEQFLIRAEARIQLNNIDDGANDINEIRNRAGLPNTTATSKEELLNAVAHERQTEFFCEWGHRWLDLKRTGTINTVMTQEKGDIWPADGHAALYPITYDQFSLNPGWQQNPGY